MDRVSYLWGRKEEQSERQETMNMVIKYCEKCKRNTQWSEEGCFSTSYCIECLLNNRKESETMTIDEKNLIEGILNAHSDERALIFVRKFKTEVCDDLLAWLVSERGIEFTQEDIIAVAERFFNTPEPE